MGKVSLLDCTLRDGGYLNDWKFGAQAIKDIAGKLANSGVEILEIGFLKKEPFSPDRTVFPTELQMEAVFQPKKPGLLYAAMVEVMNPLPVEELTPRSSTSVDVIRVIVWKRLLEEGYRYCSEIVQKGYKVCVQPARVNQYTDAEFVEMVNKFNAIDPLAVYVVDSWGTQSRGDILHYAALADEALKPGISLGYHGHNNMQQAFSAAEAFVTRKTERDLIVDASVYGMGRGAGNLNLELFAEYLNRHHGGSYDLTPMLEVFSDHIEAVYTATPWGYSVAHFLTALYDCNPEYANYLSHERGLSSRKIAEIVSGLQGNDRIMFSKETADKYL